MHNDTMSGAALLKTELADLLVSGGAHVDFDKTLKGFPFGDTGKVIKGLPYSAWQILEHMRIAQADILEYVSTPDYREKKWPEDYWPKDPTPGSKKAWVKSVESFKKDQKKLLNMLKKSDPLKPIKFANNKTLLKELLLVADHNAYHLGEFVLLRRLLGNWK
jgi:hypothetical protein